MRCWWRWCRRTPDEPLGTRRHINPFNPNLAFASASVSTLAIWDAELTRQATLIAYLNDFRAMAWFMLATLPLLFLLRRPPAMQGARA